MAGKKPGDLLSAQVVLRPESGEAPAIVTSENLQRSLPAKDSVAIAQAWFSKAGFEVGPLVGNSFSISGPRRDFITSFGSDSVPASYELPLGELPRHIAAVIKAVTFTPPPDFGPTGYA